MLSADRQSPLEVTVKSAVTGRTVLHAVRFRNNGSVQISLVGVENRDVGEKRVFCRLRRADRISDPTACAADAEYLELHGAILVRRGFHTVGRHGSHTGRTRDTVGPDTRH